MLKHKNILILGHAQHGKDTLGNILKGLYGFNYSSSSQAAADIFLFDLLKEKYGYKTPEECFEDRINRRAEWHQLIKEYNTPDKTRLAREILQRANIYLGMRDSEELDACKQAGLFDLVLGIYDLRKPDESKDSFNIDFWKECDIVIPNSGTILDLIQKVIAVAPVLFLQEEQPEILTKQAA